MFTVVYPTNSLSETHALNTYFTYRRFHFAFVHIVFSFFTNFISKFDIALILMEAYPYHWCHKHDAIKTNEATIQLLYK